MAMARLVTTLAGHSTARPTTSKLSLRLSGLTCWFSRFFCRFRTERLLGLSRFGSGSTTLVIFCRTDLLASTHSREEKDKLFLALSLHLPVSCGNEYCPTIAYYRSSTMLLSIRRVVSSSEASSASCWKIASCSFRRQSDPLLVPGQ
jgi:hypothetical protein